MMTAITANVLVAVEPVVPAALPYEKTNEHYGEGGGRRDILLRAEAPTPTSNCGVEKHGRILGVLHDGGRVDSLPLVQLRGFLAREESHGRLVNSSSRHLYSVRDVAGGSQTANRRVTDMYQSDPGKSGAQRARNQPPTDDPESKRRSLDLFDLVCSRIQSFSELWDARRMPDSKNGRQWVRGRPPRPSADQNRDQHVICTAVRARTGMAVGLRSTALKKGVLVGMRLVTNF